MPGLGLGKTGAAGFDAGADGIFETGRGSGVAGTGAGGGRAGSGAAGKLRGRAGENVDGVASTVGSVDEGGGIGATIAA
jgi:hypothetical protein